MTKMKYRPRRVYFDIKKKTPYIVKNGKRVFIRLKKEGGNTTIDHRTIKDKRQIVKVIVNTTKPHEVKSKPRRKRRIILAKKEEQINKAGNERTIYVPHYMPFPEHSQQPITINVREGGKDKEKSVVPTPVNVTGPKDNNEPKGVETQTQTEGVPTEDVPSGVDESKIEVETPIKDKTGPGRPKKDFIKYSDNDPDMYEILKPLGEDLPAKNFSGKEGDRRLNNIFKAFNIEIPTKLFNKNGTEKTVTTLEKLKILRKNSEINILNGETILNRIQELEARQPSTQVGDGCKTRPVGKGLTTKEINKLMKDEGYDVVKAIPSDCIPELVNDVNKKTEKFGFIINNEPHTEPGEHWRACFIDIPEGNVCWFDSLCGEPTRKEMKGIKVLIDKINPEYYLKFKINRIKLQGDTTNCGWFCCKFIDDMMSGKKFKEATGWDVVNGECGVENYKEKHGCMPERWGCI